MQYMNFMFVDITKSKFNTKKFKIATIFKMAAKMAVKIMKIPQIPYFSICLTMQYMNFMFFNIIKSIFDTKKFKMAANFKMAAKMASKMASKL